MQDGSLVTIRQQFFSVERQLVDALRPKGELFRHRGGYFVRLLENSGDECRVHLLHRARRMRQTEAQESSSG
jgi:hypothetical protein